ncbi:uncharacterized protein LOC125033630 [Penaeus chinensis]|uniref:uncharacterized protein LOC125033630 n=1 Tax=Penaeus chinensis TaxID=139456 RepID=UPI001FB82887|nr:uncharacterized protein LOC125033630 [Penaeus chinensis]
MASFVVRSGSEEAPRWCFRPRFLGFLTLLLLVLARSTSAGVVGRERTADTDTRLMEYFATINSDVISSHFKHMLFNISYPDILERARPINSRDRANPHTFNNTNYYNHGNYGNGSHESTSTSVTDRGRVDGSGALLQNDINSLYAEQTLKTLIVFLYLILLSVCFCGCLCGCAGQEHEVRERRQVLLGTPAAEDDPEAKDKDKDAPPTYTDILKAESPPSYSEVFPETASETFASESRVPSSRGK